MHGISPGCFAHSAARCTLYVAHCGTCRYLVCRDRSRSGYSLVPRGIVPSYSTATWSHRYTDEHSDLLNGVHGRVYLDTQQPRVCIRGPEVLYIASVADSAQSTPL